MKSKIKNLQGIRVSISLVVLVLTVGTANATFPGTNGKIAYITDEPKILLINPDGTGLEEIPTPLPAFSSRVSPDASKILYAGRIDLQFCDDIYVINRDGTGNTRLTDSCRGSDNFSWSPDGTEIAFTLDGHIWIMKADGTDKTQLTHSGFSTKGGPNWSPDGTKIAYHDVSEVDFTFNIFVMNSDGTGSTQLTHTTIGQFMYPNWSPDGTKIAFDGPENSDYVIRVMNADGSGQTQLTLATARFPSWSPDGTKIVFSEIDNGIFIATINADGTGMTRITMTQGNFPDWGILSNELTARVWIGLKNSDAVGVRLDLKAAAYLNGEKVGEGQLNNVASGSSGFNNAKLNAIHVTLIEPVDGSSGDVLSLTLSVRRTCSGGGHNSGTPRLWFNDSQANSRVGVSIDSTANEFFLREGFTLNASTGTAKKFIDVPIDNKVACPNRPFKPFGTWSMTLP